MHELNSYENLEFIGATVFQRIHHITYYENLHAFYILQYDSFVKQRTTYTSYALKREHIELLLVSHNRP